MGIHGICPMYDFVLSLTPHATFQMHDMVGFSWGFLREHLHRPHPKTDFDFLFCFFLNENGSPINESRGLGTTKQNQIAYYVRSKNHIPTSLG